MRAHLSKSNLAFLIFFSLYATGAIFLLLLGLASAFAVFSAPVHEALDNAARRPDSFGLLGRAISEAAHLSEGGIQIAIDYLLSLLNLAFGVFLVWRRPGDWVARLLGLGMVGTAAVFNFQAHGVMETVTRVIPTLSNLNGIHFILHAASGATYVHALLIFPNGKLVPRRSLWFLVVIYLVMAIEIVSALTNNGRITVLTGQISAFVIRPLSPNIELHVALIRHAELVFFVLFFGLLIPIVGALSQLYRYRVISTPHERAQTKLVVWALGLAFIAGLVSLVLSADPNIVQGAVLSDESLDRIEEWAFRIIPPLFAVIPIALFIAILRYRLFDIDLVINRTLVYGPLTAILAGLFAALIRIVQSFFVAVTGEKSDAAIVITTLVVTAAFQPLRARLQKMVDAHFKNAPASNVAIHTP